MIIANNALKVLRPNICKNIKAQKISWIDRVKASEIRSTKLLKNIAKRKPKIVEKNIAITAIVIVFRTASIINVLFAKLISTIAVKNFLVSKNGSRVEILKSEKNMLITPTTKNISDTFSDLF